MLFTVKNKNIQQLINLTLVLVGSFMVAVSINFFFAPDKIAAGGISGLAILIENVTAGAINKSITLLFFDAILLVIGYFTLGRSFFYKTALGTISLPVFMAMLPTFRVIEGDILLVVIIGSIIAGVGLSLVYYGHGSTGGTTVPPLIFKKYFGTSISIGLFLSDATVVVMALGVFGWQSFFYSIISITITTGIIDYLETGLFRSKAVYVITDQNFKIKNRIYDTFGRGVTFIHAQKAYSQTETEMMLCVVKAVELQKLKELIYTEDENAFVIVTTVSEVRGEGFIEW